jgi:hypothetical protein
VPRAAIELSVPQIGTGGSPEQTSDHSAQPSQRPIVEPDFSFNETLRRSGAKHPPLRVGLLLDAEVVPAFAFRVIEDIQSSNFADVVCYVVDGSAAPTAVVTDAGAERRRKLGPRRLLMRSWWRNAGYSAYLRVFDRPVRPELDPLAPVDAHRLLDGAKRMAFVPVRSGFVDRFQHADIEELRSHDLDVVVRFGFRILRGDVLNAAKHGVWSFHHGDSRHYRGGPAHFWELVERSPVSGVTLQRLTDELDAGPPLARSLFATTRTISVSENRTGPYWGAQHFVILCLRRLYEERGDPIVAAVAPADYSGRRRIYRTPNTLEVASWLSAEFARRSARRVSRLAERVLHGPSVAPYWRIGVRRAGTPLWDPAEATTAIRDFNWLPRRPHAWDADPFLFARDGKTWLFFEHYDSSREKGEIHCAPIEHEARIGESSVVLSEPYHLSFPNVFSSGGAIYMVPESEQAGRVDLFRATEFPRRWVRECTLLPVRCVDPSIFEFDGSWWLIATPIAVSGHAATAYVWSAPSLTGPWRLTSTRPLCSDVRRARNAGRVMLRGAELWRPSQDCSERYGRALAFNRVDGLRSGASECTVKVVEPRLPGGMLGVHTYTSAGGWEAIDGLFDR